ncbi:MAG: hypothetical protein OHK0013_34410 [Sandaracinaceae bacterium]
MSTMLAASGGALVPLSQPTELTAAAAPNAKMAARPMRPTILTGASGATWRAHAQNGHEVSVVRTWRPHPEQGRRLMGLLEGKGWVVESTIE